MANHISLCTLMEISKVVLEWLHTWHSEELKKYVCNICIHKVWILLLQKKEIFCQEIAKNEKYVSHVQIINLRGRSNVFTS